MIGRLPAGAAPLLAAIHAAAFPAAEAWSEPAFAAVLDQSGMIGVVAAEGCGFALARTVCDEGELLTLAVLPQRQRTGIGRSLLLALIGPLQEAGARRLFLEVSTQNQAAQALYSGLGFTEIGQRARYYRDGSAARLLMRDLAGQPG